MQIESIKYAFIWIYPLKIFSLLFEQILIKHRIALNLYIIWIVELGIVQNHLNVIKDKNRFKYRLSFNVSGRLFSQIILRRKKNKGSLNSCSQEWSWMKAFWNILICPLNKYDILISESELSEKYAVKFLENL